MAACPPHHQYGSPFLNPHNSSILFNDMIHTAFQHLGGLPTSDNISPQSWECCHYSPPIMATQDSPCSLDNSAITDAFFGSDQRITALDAASVHLQQEGVIENHICTDKKRKDSKVGKRKKQEKCSSGKVEKKDNGEAPIGYVRVRARRGQATDNHSLAERVRREKINARMRKLQRLVPGCDKVTGRAPMLDEIINYVQSLQNQVEFLSMKLAASAHPMQDDFTLISDHYIFHDQELDDMSPPAVQSFPRYSAIQRTAVAVPGNHCPVLDTSLPLFLRHQQDGPVAFHQVEASRMGVHYRGILLDGRGMDVGPSFM